jgi:hypothetical protein
MLRDPTLRRDLARAGREWVLEHFTQERLVERTQDFYRSTWEARTGSR